MPGFPVLHHFLELDQSHVHWVSDAIQRSHPLSSLSPPALNLSQHQCLFQLRQLFVSGGQSIGASATASVPSNKYSMLISFWIDWFYPCSPRDSQESPLALQLESINSLSLSLICGLNLTPVSDYWKKYSFDYMDLCLQSDISAF